MTQLTAPSHTHTHTALNI